MKKKKKTQLDFMKEQRMPSIKKSTPIPSKKRKILDRLRNKENNDGR